MSVATPTFNPPGGAYSAPVDVTISCATPGTKIFYTTDGTTPSAASSALYTGPVHVAVSEVLMAIAVAPQPNAPSSLTLQ